MRRFAALCILIGSTRMASAQGTGENGNPPQPEETPKAEPKGDAEAKKPAPPDDKPTEGEPEGGETPQPEAAPEEKSTVTATYDRGLKFESSDKKYELKLLFRNQVRFESYRATETGSQFLNKFYIPRSRLQASGHVFGADTRYKGELAFSDTGSFSFVKDLFIEHQLAPGPVWLRAGQWKRPFLREQLISNFAGEFNERSIADTLAGGGRDIGIGLHNDYDKTAEGIEWVIGMFNGFSGGTERPTIASSCVTDATTGKVTCVNSRPTTFPNDFGPTIVMRAGWNSARAKGYSEGDLEGGPLRYSVGGAYKIDLANFAKHGQPSLADNLSHGIEADWNLKVDGFSLAGDIVMMKLKSADAQYGFRIQPGLMVIPKHAEVALRFALTTETDKVVNSSGMAVSAVRNNIEALGAFNYFVHGHQLKIATDFGLLKKTGEDPITMQSDKPDIRVRVMGQLEM